MLVLVTRRHQHLLRPLHNLGHCLFIFFIFLLYLLRTSNIVSHLQKTGNSSYAYIHLALKSNSDSDSDTLCWKEKDGSTLNKCSKNGTRASCLTICTPFPRHDIYIFHLFLIIWILYVIIFTWQFRISIISHFCLSVSRIRFSKSSFSSPVFSLLKYLYLFVLFFWQLRASIQNPFSEWLY